MVEMEDHDVIYGGTVKAPKVLADIVESVAAAVYVDVNFDLQRLWVVRCFAFLTVKLSYNLFSLSSVGSVLSPCLGN